MTKKNTTKYKIQKKQKTLRAKEKRGNTRRRKKTAIERAIEFGVDITLLQQNLKLTPTERLQQAQAFLNTVADIREQVKAFRSKQSST